MNGPQTLEDARVYRYAKWAGFPKGHPYKEGDCVYEIFPQGRGALHRRQCNRKRQGDSPFCHSHNPQRRVEKEAAYRSKRVEDDKIVQTGEGLLKRLGVEGYVDLHPSKFEHVQAVVIPFQELRKLLERVGG